VFSIGKYNKLNALRKVSAVAIIQETVILKP
jgi:hypothetical protein